MFGNETEDRIIAENDALRARLRKTDEEFTILQREKMALGDKIRDMEFELKHQAELLAIEHERKIMQLQRDMQKALIESDLARVEATAKLEIYQKTDSREDANTIKSMVKQLIDSIGKQNVNIVK
jgi:hypothetical protein